jgi:ABC-type multidrug transport system fused ATPase/permease subunit
MTTSSISLSYLRKSISIIPQEPILFSGSVRRNLDPFGERSDERLWEVLDKVHLKTVINSFSQKLEQLLSESGRNFSIGQKQLICLVRAITHEQ